MIVRLIHADGQLEEVRGDLYESLDFLLIEDLPEHPLHFSLAGYAKLGADPDGAAVFEECPF